MGISIKEGASVFGLRPEMVIAVLAAMDAFAAVSANAVITSGVDSRHGNGSHHYKGLALDFRTHHIPKDKVQHVRDWMARALGSEYQVIVESDHIHCEYDPQQPSAPRTLTK